MTEGSEGASWADAPQALMLDHYATIATTLLITLLLLITPVSAVSFWDGNSLIHDSAEGIDYYTVPAPGYYNQSTISGASLAVNVDSGFNPYYTGDKKWRYGPEGIGGQVMLEWVAYSDTSGSIPFSTFVDWLVAVYDLDPIVVQQNSVQLQAWYDAFTAGGAGQLRTEHYWDLNGQWFTDAGWPNGEPQGKYGCGPGLPIAGRSHTFGLYDNGLGWYHYFYTYQIGDTVSSGTYTYVIGNSAWEEYIADLQNQSSILPIFENLTDPCLLNMSTSGTPGSNPYVAFSFEPVNLATGNYVYQYQDLFIEGRGLPLAITRSYNSLNPISGPFGSGWTFNYNVKLAGINGSEDVLVIREDGRTDVYNASSNGTYSPPSGIFDILTRNADGSYTLERKDHITYLFTPTGQLVNIADTNGNTINLTYAGNNLTQVTDPSGRELTFTYDAAGRIVSITDPIGRILRYTYDADGNLVRYTDPDGGNFDYTYYENHRLTSIKNPREIQIVTNTYDGDGRVISQSNALDAATTFSYDTNNRITTETDSLGRSTQDAQGTALSLYGLQRISTTGPAGGQTYYQYDGLGSVRGLSDSSGTTVSTYSYDAFGEPDVTTGFVDNDFLFTGEQMDPETGLIYLRARYYDPETGRFISKDPFTGFASVPPSLNRYTYGYNNPVRFTDPSGKAAWMAAVPGVAGAAVNDLWYMGEVIGTYAATGENTFSWCTLGGRTVGGCFGAYSGLGAGFVTKNPASAGAAWGAVEYPVDIGTQKVLSAIGVPGSTEEFSLEGLAVSAGGGAISGGAGKKIFSPNVRRNPKSFIKALNGREIQSEMKESLFGNIINKGLGIGVDSALEHIANGGK